MITLTKTELRWMLNMVVKNRENSKDLMGIPGQQFAALHKLETVINTDCKRITTRW